MPCIDWKHRKTGLLALCLTALCLVTSDPAQGQVGPLRQLQLGLGVVPGIGVQAGYISPRTFYTIEGVLYVDAVPGFAGGEGSVQTTLGVGGSIRPLGFIQMIGNAGYTGYDIDIGMRFGPGLFFAFNDSRVQKNQRFSFSLDPFLRVSSTFNGPRLYFFEAGLGRPLFRAGLIMSL